jgi:hypothetical protein
LVNVRENMRYLFESNQELIKRRQGWPDMASPHLTNVFPLLKTSNKYLMLLLKLNVHFWLVRIICSIFITQCDTRKFPQSSKKT